ncbi:MAG: hypothetical protein Q4B80_01705 [Aerococcaceae bacterium]|nr:hypothetical protein [Aerococcaceae bacterium]
MMNLVELQGSEKQVKWAQDIRNTYVKKLEVFVALSEKKLSGEKLTLEEINTLSNARWFIVRDDEKEKYEEIYAVVWNEELERNNSDFHLGRTPEDKDTAREFRRANKEVYVAYRKLKEKALIDWVQDKWEKEFQNTSAKYWIEEKRYS